MLTALSIALATSMASPPVQASAGFSAEDAMVLEAVEGLRRRIRVHAMNHRCEIAYPLATELNDVDLLQYVADMCGTPPPARPAAEPPKPTVRLWD